jgi:hypothetical protein
VSRPTRPRWPLRAGLGEPIPARRDQLAGSSALCKVPGTGFFSGQTHQVLCPVPVKFRLFFPSITCPVPVPVLTPSLGRMGPKDLEQEGAEVTEIGFECSASVGSVTSCEMSFRFRLAANVSGPSLRTGFHIQIPLVFPIRERCPVPLGPRRGNFAPYISQSFPAPPGKKPFSRREFPAGQ